MAFTENVEIGLIDIDVNSIAMTHNRYTDNISYEITVHTAEDDYNVPYCLSLETMRNYNKDIAEYIVLTANFMIKDYVHYIFPYRDNLTCTVAKTIDGVITSNYYKMVIINDQGIANNKHLFRLSEASLDTEGGIVKIEAQLFLPEIEGLKNLYVDGIYKNITVEDLMYGVIGSNLSNIQIAGNNLDINVDIYTPANDYEYPSITVPTGVSLVNLPSFLQNTKQGVYNGCIGTFLQTYNDKLTLFVYPLYHTERFSSPRDDEVTLTIYTRGDNKFDAIENTWLLDGDSLKIIAGFNTKIIDNGSNALLNGGDSIMYSTPETILNGTVSVGDDDVTYDNTEQMSNIGIKERPDGITKTMYVGQNSNMYQARSLLLKSTMATYQIQWKFSMDCYIYPGMPCCYMYEDARLGIIKLYGIVQGIFTKYDFTQHTHTSLLYIAVQSPNVYRQDTTDDE